MQHEKPLCVSCLQRIPSIQPVYCGSCNQEVTCYFPLGCQHSARLGLLRTVATSAYAGVIENLLRRFKYPSQQVYREDPEAMAIAKWLILESLALVPGPRADAIVAIPMTKKRFCERGFHPAAWLAKHVARQTGIPLQRRALKRIVDHGKQAGATRIQRKQRVKDAFQARAPGAKRIWLVDDIVTTGATLQAATKALRQSGTAQVIGICAARTLLE